MSGADAAETGAHMNDSTRPLASYTDGELWDRWVGDQSPAEFARYCTRPIATEVRSYVTFAECEFRALTDDDREYLVATLARHILRAVQAGE